MERRNKKGKGNYILTIGMEDENPAYESVRIKDGLRYTLLKPVDKVVFGIAWATDYDGTYDVRTWYAAKDAWGCECDHCRNFLELSRRNELPAAY